MRTLTLATNRSHRVRVFRGAGSAANLKVGDVVPDFTRQASNGKTFRLSDFTGKQAIPLAPLRFVCPIPGRHEQDWLCTSG